MKRLLSILICVSLLFAVCLLTAFAEDDDLAGLPETEYGEDPAEAEYPYIGGNTLYDLENEVDTEPMPENLPNHEDNEIEDDESDIYGNNSYDADNAAQLSGGEYILDEIIIKFKEPGQVPGKEKQLQHEIEKVEKVGFVEELGVYVVKVGELEKNPNAVLNRFKNNKYIESVEPNYTLAFNYIPNDPSYKTYQSKSMNDLNAPQGWDIIKGSSHPIIAVVDSGVATHPDLPPLWSGYSATAGLSYANDKISHGTAVAGVIASIGDNGIGGAGLNWNASIMAVKIDDAAGALPVANVAKGIIWAADNGAQIINLSLGTSADSSTLKSAIDYAYKKGCALFAATGNAGKDGIDYPARYANVMAVGSYTGTTRAASSNYGTGLNVMGFSSFYTTQASGTSGNSAGTSFATPQVAGLASLVWAINPKLTNEQVYRLIEQGAKTLGGGYNTQTGYGVIDIGKTLELAVASAGGAPPGNGPETPPKTLTPPVITLSGFTTLALENGQAYAEMGYRAVDCQGADLTLAVKISNTVMPTVAGLYTITYEVTDSFDQTARTTRTVTVNPPPAVAPPAVAPKITVIGSNPIILHSSSSTPYTEQMARAVDGDGTDISSLVTVSGNIDRTAPGTYTLTYSVTSPSTGLTTTATRNVRIVAPTEKREPRTKYGLSGQAKQGGKVTHTGIVSGAAGFMDLTVSSIDKNMTITAELVDTVTRQVILKDTFTAAGTKQYRIDQSKYELVIAVDKANGNSKYDINLLMPETAATYFFADAEVPLASFCFAPKIAPIGSDPIILHLGGTAYFEQGARAEDYLGNDLSGRVTISGAPDTSVAGIYWLTYSVVDDIGQESKARREVRVLAPDGFGIFEDEEVPLAEFPMGSVITHIVANGDNLTRIAEKYFGDGKRWREIYEQNKDVIGGNPHLIRAGQALRIKL